MKRILVPCDFSLQAKAAYKTAMNLASKTGGEVILLHVTFPTVYAGVGTEMLVYNQDYQDRFEQEVKSEFEKMKQEVNLPSVPSRLEFQYGGIAVTIKYFAEVNKIDLIIMGTSGSSGMAEVFIGSNTEKVVRHSPVPVLAVREYVDVSSIKKILLPTALNLDQTDFMNRLKELQKFLGATLHVLFVNHIINFRRDAEGKEAFNEFAKQYKLENYEFHFRSYRNEEEGIIDFATTEKMDLIAMATHARKGLAHLVEGSITEDVVNHITCPIWTYAMKK